MGVSDDQFEKAGQEPARAREGSMEVQQRSAGDLEQIDRYTRKRARAGNPLGAIKRMKIKFGKPGGIA